MKISKLDNGIKFNNTIIEGDFDYKFEKELLKCFTQQDFVARLLSKDCPVEIYLLKDDDQIIVRGILNGKIFNDRPASTPKQIKEKIQLTYNYYNDDPQLLERLYK